MRQYYKFVILYGLLVLLSACDISTPDNGDDITVSTIYTFNVVGNVIGDADERIVLPLRDDNERSSGLFEMDWDVLSSDPYSVEIYMSSNSVLDEATDELFLQTQCGSTIEFVCEHTAFVRCGIHFDPDYQLVQLVDENNLLVFDEFGDPVMVRDTDQDGNFIVQNERYFLRCPLGTATITSLEITDRVLLSGFPSSHYFILKVCASEEQSCPEFPFLVQLLSSQP